MKSSPEAAAPASAKAQQKLIKRLILGKPQTAWVRFNKGFGAACLAELTELFAAMRVDGPQPPQLALQEHCVEVTAASYRSLVAVTALSCVAREVLWLVGRGRGGSIGELKDRCGAVPWALLLSPGTTLGLRVESTASQIFHEGKIADLVASQLARHGLEVTARSDSAQLLDVRLLNDKLTLALSLGGRPLYQRRYKKVLQGTASVKEDIAAAAVRSALAFAAGQRGSAVSPGACYVPFAGSGTLGFEATMALRRLPPRLFFGPLAAETFSCTPAATVAYVQKAAIAAVEQQPNPPVHFVELAAEQMEALSINTQAFNQQLASAGCEPTSFHVAQGDALANAGHWPAERPLFVACNPPYGQRLGQQSQVAKLYARLSLLLAQSRGEICGFAMAPTAAVAARFTADLKGFVHEQQTFNHGGRQAYLVRFYRQH